MNITRRTYQLGTTELTAEWNTITGQFLRFIYATKGGGSAVVGRKADVFPIFVALCIRLENETWTTREVKLHQK